MSPGQANIQPSVIATSPIVPKKQEIISSMFRRPANRPSATPSVSTAPAKKNEKTKKQKNKTQTTNSDPLIGTAAEETTLSPEETLPPAVTSTDSTSAQEEAVAEKEVISVNNAMSSSEPLSANPNDTETGLNDPIEVPPVPPAEPKKGLFSFF